MYNIIVVFVFEEKNKTFDLIWKRIDPTIDPCGTPLSIHKKDEVLFIDTN